MAVVSLGNRKQKPPNSLLIQDKTFYNLGEACLQGACGWPASGSPRRAGADGGGAGGDEGLLDSIALADALVLRDEIRARRGIAVASSSETEAAAAAPPLFEMSLLRILQAGLLNFSVICASSGRVRRRWAIAHLQRAARRTN